MLCPLCKPPSSRLENMTRRARGDATAWHRREAQKRKAAEQAEAAAEAAAEKAVQKFRREWWR